MAAAYDIIIIIIGGGPAGLSAAASIVRQDHTIYLFDYQQYCNAAVKHLHTVPSWDHRDPAEFRAASLKELERYSTVTVGPTEVESIKQNEDGRIEARGSGKKVLGKKLILATGVEDVFPEIPGYAECWVSGM